MNPALLHGFKRHRTLAELRPILHEKGWIMITPHPQSRQAVTIRWQHSKVRGLAFYNPTTGAFTGTTSTMGFTCADPQHAAKRWFKALLRAFYE